MKISPIASAQNVVQEQGSAVAKMRAMKMDTNATPLQLEPPISQEKPVEGADQKLLISNNNETAKETVEATQPLSPQYAELARKRRSLQVKERELAEKEKALLDKSQGSDFIELAKLKAQPLSVLLEAGVTYEQLTEAILANQGNAEVNALKAELTALKEGVDKKFIDQEQAAEQQVLREMKKEATLLVSQGDQFELVRETKSIPDVIRLIEQAYKETGEVLDVSEACKLVEDELLKEAQKLAGLKKLQAQTSQPVMHPQQRQVGVRTLTNKDTVSVPASAKQRALAAFYGTLKK